MQGNLSELKYLTQNFVDVNLTLKTQDSKPQTPLEIAKKQKHNEFAAFLNGFLTTDARKCKKEGPPVHKLDLLGAVCAKGFGAADLGAICKQMHFTCDTCFNQYVSAAKPGSITPEGLLCPAQVCLFVACFFVCCVLDFDLIY